MKSDKNGPPIIVAGGGTGGHVMAGVAIADSWKQKTQGSVLFVGARGGLEEKIVPREGYPLELLSIGQLKRSSIIRKLKTMIQLPLSMIRSALILVKVRPKVVIGVGGYASGPLILMARILSPFLNIRTAVLEQNAVPGLTNRWLGKIAHRVFLAFPVRNHPFKLEKTSVTGNPVRKSLEPLPSAERDPFTIFVFGGSQGAKAINDLVVRALPLFKEKLPQVKWIHQTGEADHARVLKAHQDAGSNARVEKFIYDMKSAYREASLVICRAGASTLSEIAAVGRASILIPFPQAADDHQTLNAKNFSLETGAIVLNQFQTNPEELLQNVIELTTHLEKLKQLEANALKVSKTDAASHIVETMLSQNA